MSNYRGVLALVGPTLLSACGGHLPPLETSPAAFGPTVTDIVTHINCTLAEVVNYPALGKFDEKAYEQLSSRMQTNAETAYLVGLLHYLAAFNFVATAQLTLEVTDVEGLNPSFSFVTPFDSMGNRTFGVGGQWLRLEQRCQRDGGRP